MKKIDKIIMAVSLLISLIGTYTFLKKESVHENIVQASVIGEFLDKRNSVKTSAENDFRWNSANVGTKILDGSQVFTYMDSTASIKLIGQEATLELQPNTLIRLRRAEGTTALLPTRGFFLIKNTKKSASKTKVIINNKVVEISAESGSTVLIAKNRIQLIEGSVELNKEKLKVNRPVEFEEEEEEFDEELSFGEINNGPQFQLIYPNSDSEIVLSNSKEKVSFVYNIENKLNNGKYFIQISDSEDFKKVRNILVKSNTTEVIVPPKKQFWRLTDKKIYSTPRTVHPEKDSPIVLEDLEDIELKFVTSREDTRERYLISWPGIDTPGRFRIEIFSDKDLEYKLYQKDTRRNKILWYEPVAGEYYYTISVFDDWKELGPPSEPKRLISPISPLVD